MLVSISFFNGYNALSINNDINGYSTHQQKSAIYRASHGGPSTKYWSPQNTVYKTLTPFYGIVKDGKPMLGQFLQRQEAHLLERQPMSHLSFSGSSSSHCAKYAS